MIILKGYAQTKAAEPETNKKDNTMQNITPRWYTDISKGPKGKRYFEFRKGEMLRCNKCIQLYHRRYSNI